MPLVAFAILGACGKADAGGPPPSPEQRLGKSLGENEKAVRTLEIKRQGDSDPRVWVRSYGKGPSQIVSYKDSVFVGGGALETREKTIDIVGTAYTMTALCDRDEGNTEWRAKREDGRYVLLARDGSLGPPIDPVNAKKIDVIDSTTIAKIRSLACSVGSAEEADNQEVFSESRQSIDAQHSSKESAFLENPTVCFARWIYAPSSWKTGVGIALKIEKSGSYEFIFSDYGNSSGSWRTRAGSSESLRLGEDGGIGNCTTDSAKLALSDGRTFELRRLEGDAFAEWQRLGWEHGE